MYIKITLRTIVNEFSKLVDFLTISQTSYQYTNNTQNIQTTL